jgi:predicted PurR-regulated permease PerM
MWIIQMVNNNQYQRIVPFIIFIIALIFLFRLIQPVITIILSSILLAYVSFPLYNKILNKIHNKSIAIISSLFIVLLIISIPFTFLAFEITTKGYSFYNSLSNNSVKGEILGLGCVSSESKVCALLNQAEAFSSEKLSKYGFDKQIQKLLPILKDKIADFILKIPLLIAELFLTFLIAYYILKDWKNILNKIIYIIPLRTKTTNKLVKEFGNITYTVVYAQLFVAFVQGTLGAIGFFILGVPFPVILGILLAFCSLIPSSGTAIIWVPASLFLILGGAVTHNNIVLIKGILLFFYGLLIINTIDNILLARIVHKRAKVSQLSIIIGVIGGAVMFGVVGIFIGPIMLPLLITYFETFKDRFGNFKKNNNHQKKENNQKKKTISKEQQSQ